MQRENLGNKTLYQRRSSIREGSVVDVFPNSNGNGGFDLRPFRAKVVSKGEMDLIVEVIVSDITKSKSPHSVAMYDEGTIISININTRGRFAS